MYSRKKGKSGSTKPIKTKKLIWLRYTNKEVEHFITKLAKEGKLPSQIGLTLRDTYGVPDVKSTLKKKITVILKEKGLLKNLPEDLTNLIKKQIKIMKHLETNKKDQPSKRGLTLTESKIKRLIKYYKKSGRLPQDWKYDPKKARLLVE